MTGIVVVVVGGGKRHSVRVRAIRQSAVQPVPGIARAAGQVKFEESCLVIHPELTILG